MAGADLDPLIHQTTRLQILAYLYRNRQASFTTIRDALGLTSGNLQSHADRLEGAGYIARRHALKGVNFEQRYRITQEGSAAFREYVAALRSLLGEAGALEAAEAAGAAGAPGADA